MRFPPSGHDGAISRRTCGEFLVSRGVDKYISISLCVRHERCGTGNDGGKDARGPDAAGRVERIAREGEIAATSLVKGSKVSQPAVSQHLRALREAGLVSERREGRHIHYRVAPKGLAPLIDWLGHYQTFWRERFENLEQLLKEIE